MTCDAELTRKIGQKSMAVRCWVPLSVLGDAFVLFIATTERFVLDWETAC
jgi:hypothetical protein